jgi:gas vesicle protein
MKMAKANRIITGLIAGSIIGAVAGLLIAPKSGKETREIVGTRAGELRERAEEYVGNLRERFRRQREEGGIEEPSENGAHTHS